MLYEDNLYADAWHNTYHVPKVTKGNNTRKISGLLKCTKMQSNNLKF